MAAMRLLVMSDLHLEFAELRIARQAAAACDVAVLAGDIANGSAGIAWARKVFGATPVVYVPGNHEFYDGHWTATLDELRRSARRLGVHLLEDDAVDIGGVRFLGTTLWTDFTIPADRPVLRNMRRVERMLMDYRKIQAPPVPRELTRELQSHLPPDAPQWDPDPHAGGLLRAEHTLQRHRASIAWLRAQLQQPHHGPVVVVTHHAPSERSVADIYRGDDINGGFVTPLDELLPCADLWVHGHTHTSFDYLAGAGAGGRLGRVACNPRGYPLRQRDGSTAFENPAFDAALLLEV